MPNTAMDHAAILNDDKLVDSCAPRKAGGKLPIVNGSTTILETVFFDNPYSFCCYTVDVGPLLEDLLDKLAAAYTESITSVWVSANTRMMAGGTVA
ncbi:hypothetical protein OUZ56_018439 [Daphnia magna]|uniref:Uncharacterized protein n=1 Tax=Daphnia magna TaxID=35525 RepID=A0ABQ9Z8U2_9CRUS|nr:hypothetical protein OUZ56_018439 [Daphnia magna]